MSRDRRRWHAAVHANPTHLPRRARCAPRRWPSPPRRRSSPPAPASRSSRTPPRTPSSSSGPPRRAPTRYGSASTTTRTTRSRPSPTVNYGTGAGTLWANWSGVATLQHGGQYGICAQGSYSFPNDSLFIPDGPNSCSMGTMLGRRAYTTIDRSKPTAAIALAGGAAYTRTPRSPLKVDFSDDVAGPFPANFLCFQYGGGPSGLCDTPRASSTATTRPARCPRAAASRRASPARRTTARATAGAGRPAVGVRARRRRGDPGQPVELEPERRRRTRPTSPTRPATASCSTAPRRPPRSPPPRPRSRSATSSTFQSQATDATSGVGAQSAWTWGDNTAGGSGASATHTFTQAGTYEVMLTVADNAGNQATATKTITVSAAERRRDDAGRRRRRPRVAARPRRVAARRRRVAARPRRVAARPRRVAARRPRAMTAPTTTRTRPWPRSP